MATPEIGVRIRASGSDEIRAQLRLVAGDAEQSFGRVDRSAASAVNRLSTGVSQSVGAVGTVSNQVTGLFGLMKSAGDAAANGFAFAFNKVVESSGQLAAGAGIAGAGLTGLVYAARSYTQTVAEAVAGTSDMADQLELPIDQFTRLQAAFRINGGDGEKLGQGLVALKGKVVSLAEGNQTAIDAFSQLGLSMQNLRDGKGNLLGTRVQLDLVLDRIKAITNPTLQAKAVMDLFGKSGSELGSLISEGASGLKEAEKDIEKYGTVVDAATTETFGEAISAQGKLTESLKGLGMGLTKIFYPFFSDSAEGMSDWINTNRSKIEGFLTSVKGVAEKVKEDLVNIFTGNIVGLFTGGRRQGNRASTDADDGDPTKPGVPRWGREVPIDPNAPAARSRFEKSPPKIDPNAPAARPRFEQSPPKIDPDAPAARSVDYSKPGWWKADESTGGLQGLIDDALKAKDGLIKAVTETSTIQSEDAFKLPDSGAVERFAEVNGRRIRLAVQRGNDELRAFGQQAFNYPIFGVMQKAVAGLVDSVVSLYRNLSSRAFADFVALVGALGSVANQAGQAFGSLVSYVTGGISSILGTAPSLTGVLQSIAGAFENFRLGMTRGFVTPWAQNLRRAGDDIFAMLRGLMPAVGTAGTVLQAFLTAATAQLASFTGFLRRVPEAFSNIGPAVEGMLGNARLTLGGWLAWVVTWGAEFWATVNGAWARVASGIGQYVPVVGFFLAVVRALLNGFVSDTLSFGLRVAEGLTGAFSVSRLNGVLGNGREALDGLAEQARGAAERLTGTIERLRPEVEQRLGAVAEGMRDAVQGGRDAMDGLASGAAQAGQDLTARLETLRPEVQSRVDGVVEGMRGAVAEGRTALSDLAVGAQVAGADLAGRIDAFRPGVEARIGALSDGMRDAAERGREALDGLARDAGAAGQDLVSRLEVLRPEVTGRIDGLVTGVREGVDRGVFSLQGFVEGTRAVGEGFAADLVPQVRSRMDGMVAGLQDANVRGRAALDGLAIGAGEAAADFASRLDAMRPEAEARLGAVADGMRDAAARGRDVLDGLAVGAEAAGRDLSGRLDVIRPEVQARVDALSSGLRQAADRGRTTLDGLAVGAGAAGRDLADRLEVLRPEVEARLGAVADGIRDGVDRSRGSFDDLARGVDDSGRALGARLEVLRPQVTQSLDALVGAVRSGVDRGAAAMQGFVADTRAAGEGIADAVAPEVGARMDGMVAGMRDAAGRGREVLDGLATDAGEAAADFAGRVDAIRPAVTESLDGVVDGVRAGADRGNAALQDLVRGAMDAGRAAGQDLVPDVQARVDGLVDGIGSAAERGRDAVGALVEGAQESGRDLAAKVEGLTPDITGRVDGLVEGMRDAAGRGASALDALQDGARGTAEELGRRVEDLRADAGRGVSGVVDAMRGAADQGRQALGGLAQGADAAGRAVSETIDRVRPQVQERVTGLVDGVRETARRGAGIFDGFGERVREFASGFVRAIASLNPFQFAAAASLALYTLSGVYRSAGFGFASFVATIVAGGLLVGRSFDTAKEKLRQDGGLIKPSSFVSDDLRGQVTERLDGVMDGIRSSTERGRGVLGGFAAGMDRVFKGVAQSISRLSWGEIILSLLGTTLLFAGFIWGSLELKIIGVAVSAYGRSLDAATQLRRDAAERLKADGGLMQPASFVVDGLNDQLNTRLGGVMEGAKGKLDGFMTGAGGILDRFTNALGSAGAALPAIVTILGLALQSPALRIIGVITTMAAVIGRFRQTLFEGRQAALEAGADKVPGANAVASPASLIQKAAFPLAAAVVPVAFPLLGWFSRGMGLLAAELAPAFGILARWGNGVVNLFKSVGSGIAGALGIRGGSAQAVIAGLAAIVVGFLYATGVIGALQAVVLITATSFAAFFYIVGIGTFAFTILTQSVILSIRALGLAVFLMSAMGTVFTATLAAIRTGFIAFRTFMLVTAALTPLQFGLAMFGIVLVVGAAFAAILYFFPGVRKAFFGLCSSIVSAFSIAVDMLVATFGFFTDVFSDEDGAITGFFRAIGLMGRQFWDDFLNVGITVWNKLKGFFGLPQTAYINRAQEAYDEEIKKRFGRSKEEYGGVREDQTRSRETRRRNGLLPPEDPNNPDPLSVEELAKRRVARAALERAKASGKTGDEAIAAANADLAAQKKAEDDKKGGFDGFLNDSLKGLRDRWDANSKDADGKDRSLLDRGKGLLGLEGDGKADGGIPGVDTLKGLFGETKPKVATPEEIEAFRQDLRRRGLPELDVLQKSVAQFGEDGKKPQGGGGLLDGILGSLQGKPASDEDIEAFKRKLRASGLPELDVLEQVASRFGDDGKKPQAMGGIFDGILGANKGDGGPGFADSLSKLLNPAVAETKEGEAPKDLTRRAGLDLEGLFGGLKGLGGGLDGRSEFRDGIPDPVILDARQREEAARRREATQGQQAAAGDSGIARYTVEIKPGDDGIYARPEAVSQLIELLTAKGLRVKSDTPRDV